MPRNPAAIQVKGPRIEREKRTVTAMIERYCADHHTAAPDTAAPDTAAPDTAAPGELCPACADLHAYTLQRLDRCPFQEGKTTCAKCAIHCYRPDRKEQIRTVMRYAGPRMIWTHPLLAIQHLLDSRRKTTVPAAKAAKAARP